MIAALAAAIIVFLLSFLLLSLVEGWIHVLTKNPSKSYRWGVLVFALLLAGWAFQTSIGR
jgi:hypothetical protein